MNAEIPQDFFADVKDAKPADGPRMSTALRWYDGIIDDILANPGTTVLATAKRLGRNPGTISAITSSDLFKARWEQRRAAFSMALDLHLSSKLATVEITISSRNAAMRSPGSASSIRSGTPSGVSRRRSLRTTLPAEAEEYGMPAPLMSSASFRQR